ncbi:MAG: DNA polymerase I [Myxococcales bacterium]|nr:DNA polymerase I [Myxococcales bacterium]
MAEPTATTLPDPEAGDVLYVVDISGYIFRAYHALPEMSSPSGEPTNAVLGVTNMLLKLLQQQRPALLAVAMDAPGPSFRHERYAEYKANRPPAPPDLKQQIGRVEQVVRLYGIPVFQQSGVEADDLIASLVTAARARGLRCVIVSSDKDLMQLLGPEVTMYDTAREVIYGAPEVVRKLGVGPEQVRDFLALTGDSSDNVPGVPSVGPKTAVTLLSQYGDLDGVYGHLEELKRKALKAKLAEHREQAYLSQELVTLRQDLPLPTDDGALRMGEPDVAGLRQLFGELGFNRLMERLPAAAGQGAADGVAEAARTPDAELIDTPEALQVWAERLREADCFALFTVFDGGHAVSARAVGLALALEDGRGYVPLGHELLDMPRQLSCEQLAAVLGPLLADRQRPKVCADSKRELLASSLLGVELCGVVFDATLASYLLGAERHAHRFDEVVRFELGEELGREKALLSSRAAIGSLASLPIDEVCVDAARIAALALSSRVALQPKLEAEACADLLRDMELPLARVLATVEQNGVCVDRAHLEALGREVGSDLVDLEARCKQLAGRDFNVGSPRQLETILFDELGLPVIKRTKTARSTDQSVLEELSLKHDLPAAVLELRMLAKLKSTYLDALPREINPKTGRIHSDFRQTVAATGRLSSSDPNLQNIPIRSEIGRKIRDAFIGAEGHRIFSADYSQIELRVLAHISGDEELVAAYREGTDVHVRTARAIFGVPAEEVTREMRGRAKTVNFAVIYGQTQFALARNLRIEQSEAKRYIEAFFEQYSGVKRYMDEVVEQARECGYVETLCGRRRHIPDLTSNNRVKRQAAERVARNTPIQGTAADIIKRAMIAVHAAMELAGLGSKMLLTVHDELVFEAPPEEEAQLEALVREGMAGALALSVPLVVEGGWGQSWGQAH